MRVFPEVEIVISSTWREQFSLSALRARFSTDIAARIIGITPVFPAEHPPMVEQREWEIIEWLSTHGRRHEPWIALDDASWQFKSHRDQLIACVGHVGLDEAAESKLRVALCGL